MIDLPQQDSSGLHEVCDQLFIDFKKAFVFASVAHVMAMRQDSPDLWPHSKGMRQTLKDDEAGIRSVSVPA
ncbi:MAG: hypothetical protein A2091_11115 [Desulfuromonadales bacterium GWD2_61_12]|nr:MAG: hypothetical protein A2005_10525 [Desulfuromonadales bacterium GWC2_61_20]OGR35210.1 MAG: hypothetical protein A2091_11115 [Desulfuromonadales bacterium GWD2_61_12]